MKTIKVNRDFYSHTVAISSFFIIGQFIISLPFIKSFYSLLGFLISAAIGVLFCFFVIPLVKKVVNIKIILMATSVLCAFILANTFKTFCDFVSSVLYENYFITVILFSFVCLYFGLKKAEDVLKFSLLSFVYSLFVLIIFILLLSPNLKLQNLSLLTNFEFGRLTESFFKTFFSIFSVVFLLGFFEFSILGRARKSAITIGVMIGALVLLVCALSVVFLFGEEFSAVIKYPFSEAVSTATIGKLFARLDIFIYFVFFFSSLLKIEVCIFVIKFCLKNASAGQKIKLNT